MQRVVRVLLVEDSPTDALLTLDALATRQFDVQHCSRLADALEMLSATVFDVVLLDLGLPDSQGLEALAVLRRAAPKVAVVVLTGKDDPQLALKALQVGAQDYLVKSHIEANSLQRVVRYAVERLRSAQMLRESEERVRELTQHIGQVLWTIDAVKREFLYVSPAYESMWGRSPQSVLDDPTSYMEGIHPQDRDMMVQENTAMFETGHIDAECRVARPDGTVRWVWIRGYPVTEHGRVARIVGVIEDITEKRRLAVERDVLLARLQLHIDRMPLAYVLFGADGRILDWNSTAERIFGYVRSEMLGVGPPYAQITPEAFWNGGEELRARIHGGDMDAHSRNQNLTKSGRTITCHWFNTPLLDDDGVFTGFLSLARDVTEEQAMQAQFEQAQKMEAFGQLAGGVAHDFNNLLTVISGYSEILLSKLGPDHPQYGFVRAISDAGTRAAALTRQLLAFSRKAVVEPKALDLNAVLRETEGLLRRLIGEDIVIESILDPAIGTVRVDAGLIGQMLMNLAVNARDAMPLGGKLTIETSDVDVDETSRSGHPDCKAGRHVQVSVSDTGCGMTPEVSARVFEPFFTTKAAGKGTGLGLAAVFGIVKQSGGTISLSTAPGRGTIFRIYLPVVDAPPERTGSGVRAEPVPGGTETVLVVEDESAVRVLTVLALRTQGYNVLQAQSGAEALRRLGTASGHIDLLLTDVVMPGMSGRELADFLRAGNPGLKVLFQSGYTDDAVVRHGILCAEVAFLQKPYTPSALAAKVREVLDQAPVRQVQPE